MSNLDFGNQTELVERLANLTDLVTGGEQTELIERLGDLSEQLQASRRRFEPGQGAVPEKWWGFLPWLGEDENRTEALVANETTTAAPWWRFGGGAQDANRTATAQSAATKSPAEPRAPTNETAGRWWRLGWGWQEASADEADQLDDDELELQGAKPQKAKVGAIGGPSQRTR